MTGATLPGIGSAWPGAGPVVNDTRAPTLDLSTAVGQFQYTFRFELTDAVSGERLGDITPIRGATLRHDTTRLTKRTLDLKLGKDDTAAVNTLTDRVSPFMVIPGVPCPDTDSGDWPLGHYQFIDDPVVTSTGGNLGRPQLADEMFLVDQAILAGISGAGISVVSVLVDVLAGLPIDFEVEPSPFTSADAWGLGTSRGQVLEALSVSGDYFSPWFDNRGTLRFIRTFDPALRIPDMDLDASYRVLRQDILHTSDLLTAPNRFIVISNGSADPDHPVVGIADVPVNAPNSIPNRGFVIAKVVDLQLSDSQQAQAVAEGLVQRRAIFEQTQLTTAADPRHDSYNVIRWQGANWLETAWAMPLTAGAPMSHVLRKAYT